MIEIREKLKLFPWILFFLLGICPIAGHCVTLITPEEATQPDAPMPNGKHRLRLFIAYISGEKTMMEIVLNVEK